MGLEVQPTDLEERLQRMAADYEGWLDRQPLSANTKRSYRTRVRGFFFSTWPLPWRSTATRFRTMRTGAGTAVLAAEIVRRLQGGGPELYRKGEPVAFRLSSDWLLETHCTPVLVGA